MRLALLVLVLALLLCTFSCAHKSPALKLVTEDYPPLTYAVNDTVTGFGTEVVKAIQQEVKSKDKITIMNWDEAYQTALNEPNVVIFTMEKTPEREKLFNWVGPLGTNTTYFYVKKDSKLKITGIDDAKALKSIATTSNWFNEQYLKDNGFTNLKSSLKPTDNVKQVMSGEAEMSVFTDLTVNQIVQQAGFEPGSLIPVFEVLKTDFYIGISKQTSPEVVDAWTKAFSKIQQDGTLEKLKSTWLK